MRNYYTSNIQSGIVALAMLGMKWSYFMVWELNIIAVGKAELKYGNRATVQKMGVKWGCDIITDRMSFLQENIVQYRKCICCCMGYRIEFYILTQNQKYVVFYVEWNEK